MAAPYLGGSSSSMVARELPHCTHGIPFLSCGATGGKWAKLTPWHHIMTSRASLLWDNSLGFTWDSIETKEFQVNPKTSSRYHDFTSWFTLKVNSHTWCGVNSDVPALQNIPLVDSTWLTAVYIPLEKPHRRGHGTPTILASQQVRQKLLWRACGVARR